MLYMYMYMYIYHSKQNIYWILINSLKNENFLSINFFIHKSFLKKLILREEISNHINWYMLMDVMNIINNLQIELFLHPCKEGKRLTPFLLEDYRHVRLRNFPFPSLGLIECARQIRKKERKGQFLSETETNIIGR